ncbi:MAG: cytosine deaminase [Verrucomicrobiota bacterium]|nr:cytosine deaminase [Verrucomicrobiota bacterium]
MKLHLFKKRHVWLPTWPALLVTICTLLLISITLFLSSRSFLAVTQPVPAAKMLVVESWMADNSMEEIARMINADNSPYQSLWLTGPVLDRGFHLHGNFKTYSEMSAATLKALGVPAAKIHVVPAAKSQRHRTYTAAQKLKEELDRKNIRPGSIDLATLDVHARRSRLVMEKVLGEKTRVGVIALPPDNYDPESWASSSAGMKITLTELIAYLYEKLGDGGR